MHDFNKKRKYASEEIHYQEEHLEGDASEVGLNLEKLEETIKLVVDRLEGFEKILQGITNRFKKKCDNVETTNTSLEFDLQENEGDTVTLAFPLQTIEDVSQFESDDLDSIVETFIKNLFSEHKNFSIVFKCLLKDELTVILSDWDKMSKYRFFSEILYGMVIFFCRFVFR